VTRKTDVDFQPLFKFDSLRPLPIHELFNFGNGVTWEKERPGIPLDV